MIRFISISETLLPIKSERYYYLSITSHIEKLKQQGKKVKKKNQKNLIIYKIKNQVSIVGHSLGGALSAISGALTSTSAVSISGPGTSYIHKKIGFSQNRVSENVVSIIPSHDIVPLIDSHQNLIYSYPCHFKRPDLCHMPSLVFCKFASQCQHEDFLITDCSFSSY